jgi:Tfp pilus tip-associated adhesin PilY1
MKQTYHTPGLVEYGRIEDITLGATGDKVDATININTGAITVNGTAPTCTNNVASGYCYSLAP